MGDTGTMATDEHGSRLTAGCPGCPLCTAQLRESQNPDWDCRSRDSGRYSGRYNDRDSGRYSDRDSGRYSDKYSDRDGDRESGEPGRDAGRDDSPRDVAGTVPLGASQSEPHPLHSVSFTEAGSRPSQFSRRPRRIILVRHGQSEGNVDASVYTREADWRVPLTELGFREAEEAGWRIRELIERSHAAEEADEGTDWACFFYVSPYTRTLQTLKGIGRAFEPERILGVREEPRLREQDFGNFQVKEQMELTKCARERFGKFFFRFPEGESAADVYDRVTGFLDSFWRDVEWGRMHPSLRKDITVPASQTGTGTGAGTGISTGTGAGTGAGTGTGVGAGTGAVILRAVEEAVRGSCAGRFPEARAASAGFGPSWGVPGTFREASPALQDGPGFGEIQKLGPDLRGGSRGNQYVMARRTVSLQGEARAPGEGCLRGFTYKDSGVGFQAVQEEGKRGGAERLDDGSGDAAGSGRAGCLHTQAGREPEAVPGTSAGVSGGVSVKVGGGEGEAEGGEAGQGAQGGEGIRHSVGEGNGEGVPGTSGRAPGSALVGASAGQAGQGAQGAQGARGAQGAGGAGGPAGGGEKKRYSVNVVMVTHGLTSRVFLMRWFRWTVAQFEGLSNPRNCEIRAMQLAEGGRYSLAMQHSKEELLSWGFSPCMVADQYARKKPEEQEQSESAEDPPSWACFFDHIPWKGKVCENAVPPPSQTQPAVPSPLDTPI